MNLSQDQEKRLEKELAEEKRTKETDRERTGEEEEEEQRLRKLLAEAEVRERKRRGMTVNLTSVVGQRRRWEMK